MDTKTNQNEVIFFSGAGAISAALIFASPVAALAGAVAVFFMVRITQTMDATGNDSINWY